MIIVPMPILAPSCKLKLARFSAKLRIQDGAKCGNILKVYAERTRRKLRGNVKKTNSISIDIIQIEVDLPPSYPIFDKFIFDKELIMLTSLPPLEFLTEIMKF